MVLYYFEFIPHTQILSLRCIFSLYKVSHIELHLVSMESATLAQFCVAPETAVQKEECIYIYIYIYILPFEQQFYIYIYSFTNTKNDDGSEVRYPTDVMLVGFRSLLEASHMSRHTEEF